MQVAPADVGGSRVDSERVVRRIRTREREPGPRHRLADPHVLVGERCRSHRAVARDVITGHGAADRASGDRRGGDSVVGSRRRREIDDGAFASDVRCGARRRVCQVVVPGLSAGDRDPADADRLTDPNVLVRE